MNKTYEVTFNFMKDLEKSIMVQKKTKKQNKVYFVPKSIVLSSMQYVQHKSLCTDIAYSRDRICLGLPQWYCKNVLGFYK